MKIGLLGGSFDPIHNGHMHMAISAYMHCQLDEVWLIPAGHTPHKNEQNMTVGLQRLKMCQLAAMEYPYIKVSSVEVESEETSYTYLTLQKLTKMYPEDEFYFIMGADSIAYFDKWRHPEIISSLCTILVVNRGEYTQEALEQKIAELKQLFPCRIQVISCEKYHASSTNIRDCLKKGMECSKLLPPQVLSYIMQNHIYGEQSDGTSGNA